MLPAAQICPAGLREGIYAPLHCQGRDRQPRDSFLSPLGLSSTSTGSLRARTGPGQSQLTSAVPSVIMTSILSGSKVSLFQQLKMSRRVKVTIIKANLRLC